MYDQDADPNIADTPAKYSLHLPRLSIGLIAEAVAVAAGIVIVVLLLLQVGNDSKELTAMRQDDQAKAVLGLAQTRVAENLFAMQMGSQSYGIPPQRVLQYDFPGYGLRESWTRESRAAERRGDGTISITVTSHSGHKFWEEKVYKHGATVADARGCSGLGRAGGCDIGLEPYHVAVNGFTGTF